MKKTLNNRQKAHLMVSLAVMASLVIFLCSIMIAKSKQIISNETQKYLLEVSQQAALRVNQQIQFNIDSLKAISQNLILFQEDDRLMDQYLETAASRHPFPWIGVTDTDGILTAFDGQTVDLSGYETVQEALGGQPAVSKSLITCMGSDPSIMYAHPIIQQDNIAGAVVTWVKPDTLEQLKGIETFNGYGFSHIISRNGDFILKSNNKNAALSGDNLFETLQEAECSLDNCSLDLLKTNIANGNTGYITLTINNTQESMNYIPLNYGDWYLLSVVPTQIYARQISEFTRFSVMVNIAIALLFLTLISSTILLYKKSHNEISKIAYEDPITLGFTSNRFEIEIKNRMESFTAFTFVSLDIRKFKLINDTFGSEEGNRVLKHVHDTIKTCLNSGEYVSRISSDTFNLILNTTNKEDLKKRLTQMASRINEFNLSRTTPYYLPLDCGIYIISDNSLNIITMRDRANSARKNDKTSGNLNQCNCCFYSELKHMQLLREKNMENNMELALHNQEFVVYLQPKVSLKQNRVVGAEALVRWDSPENGLIPPGDFIPFFERNGFILKLDMFVFEEVCKILAKWIQEGKEPIPISVNLSRIQLKKPGFLKQYQAIQERYSIPPQLLEMELTETIVFENLDYLKQIISEIHQLGFRCSMDDFGSGYSSLNVLKEVPVDTLKLDRVFFDKESSPRGNMVVESVINLARKLGMTTVSEGIETTPQVKFLRTIDCDIVQGYVFSRPLKIKDFEEMVFEKSDIFKNTD